MAKWLSAALIQAVSQISNQYACQCIGWLLSAMQYQRTLLSKIENIPAILDFDKAW